MYNIIKVSKTNPLGFVIDSASSEQSANKKAKEHNLTREKGEMILTSEFDLKKDSYDIS